MLRQRSFEELGTPLADTTFCVVDLETTGASPRDCGITEVGAVKVRRGEVVGTFQTLVDPGCPVPTFIRLLTGISDDELADAPPISGVLPSLLEFVRGTVLVAHNARFDVSFLNHALTQHDHPPLDNQVLDTAGLARKVLAGEVPNHRLATLARYLRCAHQPCHRAFADVLATVDVLHHLIERVAGFGVVTLEDLISLSASRLDGTFSKIALTNDLPKSCGVYRFVGASGNTLYVGKSSNVRERVRSYFYGDPRRKIKDLLRETQVIRVEEYANTLEAEVAEARAIQRELPPYNRVGKRSAQWYVKATSKGRSGKVAAARTPKDDGSTYLGPFRSVKVARAVIDALRDASRLHRCPEPSRCKGCVFDQLDRCAGGGEAHKLEVEALIEHLLRDPRSLYQALARRMRLLAGQRRFEEAAELRDRAALLARTLSQNARIDGLARGGDILLAIGDRAVVIRNGRLALAIEAHGSKDTARAALAGLPPRPVPPPFRTAEELAEGRILCAWLEKHAEQVRLLEVTGCWAMPVTAAPCQWFSERTSGALSEGVSVRGRDLDQAVERAEGPA